MKELEKKRGLINTSYLWIRRFKRHYKKIYSNLYLLTCQASVTLKDLDIKMGTIRQRYCKYAEKTKEMDFLWRCRIYHRTGRNDPAFLLDRLIEGQCSNCRLTRKEKDIMFLGKKIK